MDGGIIESDLRIRASLPTIEYLESNGAKKIVLISHLGRPEGEKKPELSLKPVADKLSEIINNSIIRTNTGATPSVRFVSEAFGEKVSEAVNGASDGDIILLENLRFWPEEEKNDSEFAKSIVESTGAELFVQDGFAVIHRAHASTDAVCKNVPAVSGLLVEKEVSVLSGAISNPEHPVIVIIGGAKVDDKRPLIEKFLGIADTIIVGGKIASDGYDAEDAKIYVAEDFNEDADGNRQDIGTKSTKKILEMIHTAKTVVWNGTVGRVEVHPFEMASKTIARALGNNKDVTSIICGGDTTGFVEGLQLEEPELKYSLISTGGGASLELLSGLELPGLNALQDK
jgi:phosphoglycerate kinase